MLKNISKLCKTSNNILKKLSLKNFRDYRNEVVYFRDYRYKSGEKNSPYVPQFTLTEVEREGK